MTNKEFLIKLRETNAPFWLEWVDDNTVIISDLDDAFTETKVIFNTAGNAVSIEEVPIEGWR